MAELEIKTVGDRKWRVLAHVCPESCGNLQGDSRAEQLVGHADWHRRIAPLSPKSSLLMAELESFNGFDFEIDSQVT
jgi:hypothetical protein